PTGEVMRLLENARSSSYRQLRGLFTGADLGESETMAPALERLHTVILSAEAASIGWRLGDLGLEERGVLVAAVRRGGIRGEEPTPDLELREGDALVLQGPSEQLEWAEKRLLSG
ncbi:MAG TPA: TrkA C-terminal domain-containing protein, partial [Gammaproteobacteria bacterium]|nr:TrkA C-terminal domain-containing protein [Gammaproteobacteria bacterium]